MCFRRGDSVTSKTRQRTKLSVFESKRVMMHWVRSVLFCAWTVYWGCVFMLCIRMQLQLTHFVLRCLRCACLAETVGCPCVRVFIDLMICCVVHKALCFACVATLNINTPWSFIVNFVLLCFLACGLSWLCRLTVCELQVGESCALKLGENWFSFVDWNWIDWRCCCCMGKPVLAAALINIGLARLRRFSFVLCCCFACAVLWLFCCG